MSFFRAGLKTGGWRSRGSLRWLVLGLLAALLPAAEPGNVRSDFAEKFFRERVQPVFVEHCYECHGNGKHKGGLSMATLHDFLAGGNEALVLVPGDVHKSPLITAIRWEADDTELNMPPKNKLSDEAIADLTRWVEMGAPWPVNEAPTVAATTTSATTTAATTPIASIQPPLVGRLHPVVVHFPIACLLLAVLAETLVLLRGAQWRPLTSFLVLIGAAAAAIAVLTGTWLATNETAELKRHQLLGWITLICALVSSGLLWVDKRWVLRIALVLTAAAVGLTGHLGGVMVYGKDWFNF